MSSRGHVDSSYSVKVDNYGRKTWDKDEWEKKAKARQDERRENAKKDNKEKFDLYQAKPSTSVEVSDSDSEGGFDDWDQSEHRERKRRGDKINPDAPVKRSLLQQRDFKLDFDSKLGKTTVITKNDPSCTSGGYYCDICDCVIKDSTNYLDHINGTKHQRNLGMSMKIERSSLSQVKQRFSMLKQKQNEKTVEYDFNKKMDNLKEKEDKYKEYKKEKKKEKKQKAEEAAGFGALDPDMAAIMGFSSFGGSKKN